MKNQILVAVAAGALSVLCVAAQAGQWVVAGYEYSEQAHEETQTYGRQTLSGTIVNDAGFERLVSTTDQSGF